MNGRQDLAGCRAWFKFWIAGSLCLLLTGAKGNDAAAWQTTSQAQDAHEGELSGDNANAARGEESVQVLAAQRTAEPLHVLGALGIGQSELQHLRDGQALDDEERATLVRLLHRIPAFSLNQRYQWSQWEPPWAELQSEPQWFRGVFCRVEGIIDDVSMEHVPPILADAFPFDHFFRLEISLLDGALRCIVFARSIPEAWRGELERGRTLRERAGVMAMFLKRGPEAHGGSSLVFITDRVSWYPDGAEGALPRDADVVWLAGQGLDVARLMEVTDSAPLSVDEREAFYQALAVVGNVPAESLAKHAARDANLRQLLLEPHAVRGEVFTLTGRARRAVKIEVDDPSIRQRYGMDHYYEVELFVDSDVVIRIRQDNSADGPTTDEQTADRNAEADKVFHSYPIVFCVRSLPAGMPVGESINEVASVTGMYFKIWGYASEYVSGASGQSETLQVSPLLIAQSVHWSPAPTGYDRVSSWLLAGLFVGLALTIGLMLWHFAREDRRLRRRKRV